MEKNKELTKSMTFVLAFTVATVVANNYYVQPILSDIATSLDIAKSSAGIIITLIQAGYGLGVLFLVPLGDIVESKKLSLIMLGATILGVLGLAFTDAFKLYCVAALITGIGASLIQLLIPFAAGLVAPEKKGKIVGTLMSGLMLGVMLSRPIASFLTATFSWHAVFIFSAILMLFVGVLISLYIPKQEVAIGSLKYFDLLKSMRTLWKENEILRRRSIYQAFLFGSFCLFWTASPLYLASSYFNFDQKQIALFALAGVTGAIVAPYAGTAADKGKIKQATFLALAISCLSYIVGHLFSPGSNSAIVALVLAAIFLDAGITANLVLGQRSIFSIAEDSRSRVNGIYVATIFVGGGIGSALGAYTYAKGGWDLSSLIGFVLPLMAFLYFLTERRSKNLYSFMTR